MYWEMFIKIINNRVKKKTEKRKVAKKGYAEHLIQSEDFGVGIIEKNLS
jgi:hypothetical protein